MKREIEAKLVQMLSSQSPNRVIVIEGARQVGKSYLVNQVLQSQTLPVLAFDLEKKKRLRNQIDQTEEFADFQNLLMNCIDIISGIWRPGPWAPHKMF